jgi:hypothetical protein
MLAAAKVEKQKKTPKIQYRFKCSKYLNERGIDLNTL